MRLTRKLLMGAGAVLLPLGLVTLVDTGTAWATPIVANGTIKCTALAVTVKFTPPIENTGDTNSAKAVASGTVKTCTTTATNIGTGTVTGTFALTLTTTSTNNSANSCAGLASGSRVVSPKVSWKDSNGKSIAPSVITFSGYDLVSNATSHPGFDLPQDSGGTVSMTAGSSFKGTDAGATSQANAYATLTTSQLSAACGNATTDGLASLKLNSAGTALDPGELILS